MSAHEMTQEKLQGIQDEFFAAIGLGPTTNLVGKSFAWGFRIREGWVGWTGAIGSVFVFIKKDNENHKISIFPTTSLTVELNMEGRRPFIVEIIGLEREVKEKRWLPILRDWKLMKEQEWKNMGGDLHILP